MCFGFTKCKDTTKKDEKRAFEFVFWFWKSKNGVEKLFLLLKSLIFAY